MSGSGSLDPSDPAAAAQPPARQHIVILSGLSGAGKTAATKLFEDLGYTCVDNLPGELLPDLAELVSEDRERFEKTAIVLDVRAGDAVVALAAMRGALEGRDSGRRSSSSRRATRSSSGASPRPATATRWPTSAGSPARSPRSAGCSIPVRDEADVVLDTSDLSLRELREKLFIHLADSPDPDRLAIQLISFGFKYGVPLEADLVFDVRFMQNPYYIEELRPLSGLTEAVRAFVLDQPTTGRFLGFLRDFLTFAVPAYVAEGKTRLTIGIGCTGGYHRSIAIAEEIAAWLRERDLGSVAVFHRELERG